jgi:acyl transferase domain-containing protein
MNVVDLRSGKLKIVLESTAWPGQLRRASVNSFGYGGANAHTILEAIDVLAPGCGGVKAGQTKKNYTPFYADREEVSKRRHYLLPFSAHNDRTVMKNIEALQTEVDKWDLLDIAFTLGSRRSKFTARSFAVAEDGCARDALQTNILSTHKAQGSGKLRLGFVFTGQS